MILQRVVQIGATFLWLIGTQTAIAAPLPSSSIVSVEELLAQDQLTTSSPQTTDKAPKPIVPLVYAENLQAVVTDGEIQGTFTITNTEAAYVGDIHYEIQLLGPAPAPIAGQLTPDDASLYDQSRREISLAFGPQEVRQVSFQYQPPAIPTGAYRLRVQLITSNDRAMGWATTAITLENKVIAFASLAAQEVEVSSRAYGSGEARQTWGPLEGVNVDPGQKIILHATAFNAAPANLKATPIIEWRRLLTADKTSQTTRGEELLLKAKESKVLDVAITAPTTPGAYVTFVHLEGSDGKQASSLAQFRYVVRGASASIVSAKLQPATAQEPGIALVDLVIVGPADRETILNARTTVTILSGEKAIGIAEDPITLSAGTVQGVVRVPLQGSLQDDLTLQVALHTENGQLLDTYSISFANLSPTSRQAVQTMLKSVPSTQTTPATKAYMFLVIIGILALLALVAWITSHKKKDHHSLPPLALLLVAASLATAAVWASTTYASGIQYKFFSYTTPWVPNGTYVDLFINSPRHNSTVAAGNVPFEVRLWWAACLNEFHKGDILVFSLPAATHFSFDTQVEPASPPWQGQAHYAATFDGGGSSEDWGRAISYITNLDLSAFAPGSKTTIWTRAFTAARYGSGERVDSITNDFTFLNFSNPSPVGYFDGNASCQTIGGWACDSDDFSKPLTIHLYDGPAGGASSKLLTSTLQADQPREAAVSQFCGGYNKHGFSFPVPDSLKDNQPHQLYAYAINIGKGDNTHLPGSPITLQCDKPPVTPDVSVTKQAPGTVQPGSTLTYLVTAKNNSATAASNVKIVETIPSGLIFNTSVSDASVSPCLKSGNTLTCTIATLAAHASSSLAIFYDVPSTMTCPNTLHNTVSLSAPYSSTSSTDTLVKCDLPSDNPKQCSDTADNDNDGKIDAADPGCHSDGNADNPLTYDPNDDNESNIGPTVSATISPSPTSEGGPIFCSPPQQAVFVSQPAVVTALNGQTPIAVAWSAPGGSPSSGNTAVLQTSYTTAGPKTISFTYAGTTKSCAVVVFPTPPPESPTPSASASPSPTSDGGGQLSCNPPFAIIHTNQNMTFSVGSSSTPASYTWTAFGATPSSGSGTTFQASFASEGSKTVTVSNGSKNSSCNVQVTGQADQNFECMDTKDNDQDGLKDINDPACHSDYDITNIGSFIPTNNESPDRVCSDGKDNDADGKIDAADPACHTNHDLHAPYEPSFNSEADTQCSDTKDNDGDGVSDTDDPGCHVDNNSAKPYLPAKDDERNNVPFKPPGIKEGV